MFRLHEVSREGRDDESMLRVLVVIQLVKHNYQCALFKGNLRAGLCDL